MKEHGKFKAGERYRAKIYQKNPSLVTLFNYNVPLGTIPKVNTIIVYTNVRRRYKMKVDPSVPSQEKLTLIVCGQGHHTSLHITGHKIEDHFTFGGPVILKELANAITKQLAKVDKVK